MSNTSLLGAFGAQDSSSLMFRNRIINGNFDIWQRGTSQTSSSYGSDDRWLNEHNGSTKTHSQQAFTLGQTDVPGNPSFFSRTVVSSVAGANNYVAKFQRVESVRTLAGQTATVSFWAKADAPKNIAIEFLQSFGSGGPASVQITGIGITTIALTTSWKYFTVTVSVPSISGKTLGTIDDGFLQVVFWFDAGSAFNARTNSLGQQSGTFDLAQVQLEAGSVATPFERRPIGTELALCQRYYEQGIASVRQSFTSMIYPNGNWFGTSIAYKATKRISVNATLTTTNFQTNCSPGVQGTNITTSTAIFGVDGFSPSVGGGLTSPTTGTYVYWEFNWATNAEL